MFAPRAPTTLALAIFASCVQGARADTTSDLIAYGACCVLMFLSATFSGLTLGLLGLDKIGLEVRRGAPPGAHPVADEIFRPLVPRNAAAQIVISADPNSKDAKNARAIAPIRNNGNLLLCTLLLGNVAVNALLSIFLAQIAGGLIGFLVSTAGITLFGEIMPQATCSRHALGECAAGLAGR